VSKTIIMPFKAALAASLFGLTAPSLAQPGQVADAIFVNGKVFTADGAGTVAEGFAIKGDRFVAAGSSADMRRLAGPATRIVDLKGRFVSPGLTDAHFHSEGGGKGVDLSKVANIRDILTAIGKAAAVAKPGEVILTNRDWHEMQLKEQRLPTALELDTVAPNHPVVVKRGGHSYILNSAALAKWNITPATVSPAGGHISKDATGALTGELFDNAKTLVTLPPDPPVTVEDVLTTQRVLNSYGITSVRVIGGYKTDTVTAYKLFSDARDAGKLSVRYNVFLRNRDMTSDPATYVATLEQSGLRQYQGDHWVRIGGIKLGVDGGFEGGHMSEPYIEPYGKGGTYYGLVTMKPDAFTDVVKRLNANGWVLATHAAGDAAVEQVLDAYEAANAIDPIAGDRWAIEHIFITNPEQLRRAKALGLYLSVQNHLFVAGPAFRKYIGEPRASQITPLKTYLDSGMNVALGTDADVIPINPYWELYHYMTRQTRSDGIYGADERVPDRAKLLELITAGYARLTGEEAVKGSIAPGKLADFVVMSGDFLTVPVEQVRDMKALTTYVGGKQVFRDPAFQ